MKTVRNRNYRIFSFVGIFSTFLLVSSIIAYVFLPSLGLKATDTSQTIGPYSMSMSMNSNVEINAVPTPTQNAFSGLNNISVTNTCTSGASIYLTSRTASNDLVNTQSSSNKISATTTNTLENNTWGFSKDGGTTWSGVPKSSSEAITLYDASEAQDTATNVSVLYGVKIDSSILSGSYTNDVVYTMLPKSGCSSYNITWNQNGGTANPTGIYPTTMSWEQNIDLSTLTPARNGYNFAGWSNGTTTFPVTSGATNINPDNAQALTMTAVWTPINYTIAYDLKGGSTATPNPTSYNAETATFTLVAPTLSGYEFIGWTGSNGTTPQEVVTITKGSTGNREYTANYSLPNFNITYNLDGGTVSPANPAKYNVGTETFTLTNPTKMAIHLLVGVVLASLAQKTLLLQLNRVRPALALIPLTGPLLTT